MARAQQGALSECLDTTLATKNDISHLELRVASIEGKINKHSWMLGLLITGMGTIISKLFF